MPRQHLPRQAGQHIAVTGAGTGIGRAIALRLAAEGARVSLFGRRIEPLQETAAAIVQAGGSAPFVASVDVAQRKAVRAGFSAAADALGPLRACVANAGIGGANFPKDDDRFDEIIATNLAGTYHTLRAAQAHLAPGPEGRHLLAFSSILGRIGVPWYTAYCASKAGILGLVRALAVELAGDGVQVNAICPGWVSTDMAWQGIDGMATAMKTTREAAFAGAMSAVPLGRMSEPEDVAGLVAYLLSADARGITGQALDMNNGAFMI